MTGKLPIPAFPLTLLAQFGDASVFQTAAFANTEVNITGAIATGCPDINIKMENSQYLLQAGQPSYGRLNLGLHVNDDPAKVLGNRMRLLTAINEQLAAQQRLPINRLYWVNQIHGKQIYDIDNNNIDNNNIDDNDKASATLSMRPMDADAIVSQQANLGLAIMTADCVPIVLYQPASGQIAAIHAGWQGLACGVIKATAERFTAAGPIMGWIGVSISQENYEVGRQVRDKLLAGCIENKTLTASNLGSFDQLYCISADASTHTAIDTDRIDKNGAKPSEQALAGADKVKLDLPKLAYDQLVTAAVKVVTDLPVGCSYGDERYYSYRRQTHLQQPATGRMALIIVRSLLI